MSNPSWSVNKYAKGIVMHLVQHPVPVKWGGNKAINPSTCPIRMADAVQSLRRRGPADARDLLFQRNQAAGVMSTMSTLSC